MQSIFMIIILKFISLFALHSHRNLRSETNRFEFIEDHNTNHETRVYVKLAILDPTRAQHRFQTFDWLTALITPIFSLPN